MLIEICKKINKEIKKGLRPIILSDKIFHILKKELSETENRINKLEGIWATDSPDKIPENIRDLFFEIKE